MIFCIFAVIAIVVLAVVAIVCAFKLGVKDGQQEMINRLLDAKDPESWNQAHYLRIDTKESRRLRALEANERTLPMNLNRKPESATTQVIKRPQSPR